MKPQDFVTLWNTAVAGTKITRCFKMSRVEERYALEAIHDEEDPAVWAQAFALIAADPFYRGTNDRGWRADLEYALRPSKRGTWLNRAREAMLSREEAKHVDTCACGKPVTVTVSGQGRCEVYCEGAERARERTA